MPGSADTVTFDGSSGGGTVTLAYNPTIQSIACGAFTGTLDFSANRTLTMGTFNGSGSGTRTFTFGNSTFNITGSVANAWTILTTTGLTFTPNTATINITGNGIGTTNAGALTYGGSFNFTGGGIWSLGNSTTFNNLSFTGTTGTDSLAIAGSAITVTGTLSITGLSSGAKTSFMSATPGTLRTMTFANASFQKVTFVDVNLALTDNGAGNTWSLSEDLSLTVSSTGMPGLAINQGTFNANGFNVSVGTLSSPGTLTRGIIQGSGTWSIYGANATIINIANATGFSFTKGSALQLTYSGSTGTRTVTLPALAEGVAPDLSFTAGSDTVTLAASRSCGSLNFTGFAGTFTSVNHTIYGNLTFSAAMTVSGSQSLTMAATSGTQTITSNGNSTIGVNFIDSGASGTTKLGDNLTTTGSFTLSAGTFDTNSKNLTCASLASSGSSARTLTLGSSTVTLTGTGTVWDTSTSTNLTLNAGTSTIKVNDSSSATKIMSMGGTTLYNLLLSGTGTGVFQLGTGTTPASFNNIAVENPPHTVQVFAGKTLTVSSLSLSGASGNLNTIQSTANGSPWTITANTGVLTQSYLSLQDSHASGAAFFVAGHTSTNAGGNTGWIFGDLSTKVLSDTVTLTDTLAELRVRILTETISLADTLLGGPKNFFRKGITLLTTKLKKIVLH